MNSLKKTVMKVLSAAIAVMMLAGCANAGTLGTINGEKINTKLYMFFLKNIKENLEQQAVSGGTTAEEYWKSQVDGLPAAENAKKLALDEVARTIIVREKAAELKLELTADDVKAINDNINNLVSQNGSKKEYDKWVKEELGLTNDLIKYIFEGYAYDDKLYDYYFGETSTFKPTDAELESFLKENYVRAKHVLILNSNESTGEALTGAELENAKATADSVSKKAASGADFDKLIKDYGKDPGMESYPNGYYFTRGEMVKPFEEAVYGMKENTVSGTVETDYGWHIIQRLPLDAAEYLKDNRDALAQAMANKAYGDKMKEFIDASDIKTDAGYNSIDVLKVD